MLNWASIGLELAKTLGAILMSLITPILSGKAIRKLIGLGLEKWAKKKNSAIDDKIVKDIETDWGIDSQLKPVEKTDDK